jgi:hypothetical protein
MADLLNAMNEVNDLNRTHGLTQRGGKKYTEVFVRVEAFRKAFGLDFGINTEILVDDGQRVVVKATVTNAQGTIIGSGMAEEIRGQGNVNKTSALENGETSAIGRALASLGLHGGSYASLNEIDAVQRKTQAMAQPAPAAQPATPKSDKEQAIAWCKDLVAKYNAANSRRELSEIDRNTPDAALEALKNDYPDLHQLLIERFTQKENNLVN